MADNYSARNNGAAVAEKPRRGRPTRAEVSAGKSSPKLQRLDSTHFEVATEVHAIPIHQIRSRKGFNPRKHFDQEELQKLADSIKQYGVQQPIRVRHTTDTVSTPKGADYEHWYEIIMGERRFRASQLAGLTMVPAIIVPGRDEKLDLELALLENLLRVDLDPIEEAEGYARLMEMGYKQKQIAERVNRSQPAVANSLRLLKLPETVQTQVADGTLSTSHALTLTRYSDYPEVAKAIGDLAIERKISSRDLEKGLPWEIIHALSNKGTIKALWYGAEFDWEKTCRSCPFNAYRNEGGSHAICLKPEHFRELNEEVEKKAQQKRERAAKKLSEGKPGAKLPTVKELEKIAGGWSRVKQFGKYGAKPPAGCSSECSCRRKAMDGEDVVECCIDAEGQLRKLQSAESRRTNKEIREKNRALRVQLAPRMDSVTEIDTKLLAIVINRALTSNYQLSQPVDAIVKRMGLEISGSRLRTSRHEGGLLEALEDIAGIEPQKLIRLTAEALMMEEFHEAERNPQPLNLMAWWLGAKKARRKKGAKEAPQSAQDGPEDEDRLPALVCRNCGATDEDPMSSEWEEDDLCPNCDGSGTCRVCGCTDGDCRQCIEKTGEPCHWIEPDLCSACAPAESDGGGILPDESTMVDVMEAPAAPRPPLVCDTCARSLPGSLYDAGQICPNQHCMGRLVVRQLGEVENA